MHEIDSITQAEAAQRSGTVSGCAYRVGLDLTGDTTRPAFTTSTTVSFRSSAGARTFIDCAAEDVVSVRLNGVSIDPHRHRDSRIPLDNLRDANTLEIVSRHAYQSSGTGLNRYVDHADGRVYLHTKFEPNHAHKVFPCFDQPDIKGTFEWAVTAPSTWVVVSNRDEAARVTLPGGTTRWSFPRTAIMPTYVTAVVAGPYASVADQHNGIDLGLWCRQSLREYLDPENIFGVTKDYLDAYVARYRQPYPWGRKYDQLFVPGFMSGAMENAAAVTISEQAIFQGPVPHALREWRRDVIGHEFSHMWFGNLVTMRWWDDLWLNEAFATAEERAVGEEISGSDAGRISDTMGGQIRALRQDQMPSTHPIVAPIPSSDLVGANFDDITYRKGAAVLGQLREFVGGANFVNGVRRYLAAHLHGNASLHDLLDAMAIESRLDVRSWAGDWLMRAGVNILRPDLTTHVVNGTIVYRSFAVVQEAAQPEHPTLRPHRLTVGRYDVIDGVPVGRPPIDARVEGARTEIPALIGEPEAALVIINDANRTYSKVRLDDTSIVTVTEHLTDIPDPLARAVIWATLWDMVRDGEIPAQRYLGITTRHLRLENHVTLIEENLALVQSAINNFADPAARDNLRYALASTALDAMRSTTTNPEARLAWFTCFVATASVRDEPAHRHRAHIEVVRDILDGTEPVLAVALSRQLRWQVVVALAGAGVMDATEIDAEERRDNTNDGHRRALQARAAQPAAAAKAEAWRLLTAPTPEETAALAIDDLPIVATGFNRFGQEDVLRPFAPLYLPAMRHIARDRGLTVARALAGALYPRGIDLPMHEADAAAVAGGTALAGLPPAIARLVRESGDDADRARRARELDVAATGR